MACRPDAFLNEGAPVRIVGDASPWGFGAYLVVDGTIAEFYTAEITEWEAMFLQAPIGSAEGQQVWEALNLVVALRLWKQRWATERVRLEVRADNVAALTLLANLRGKGFALNLLAREIAIDLGDGSFRPDVLSHTPGVASSVADALSRRYVPERRHQHFVVPHILLDASEVAPPPRDEKFFSTYFDAAEHWGIKGASKFDVAAFTCPALPATVDSLEPSHAQANVGSEEGTAQWQ